MFIIDLRNKTVSEYRFSVINNSNVDEVYIYSHFTQYQDYSIYLKVRSVGGSYVDKIAIANENITIIGDALVVKWLMGAVSTQCKKIEVQLQFENGDEIIAQSKIVSIILADTIDVSKEITPIYPDVLKDLQEQIDYLKPIVENDNEKLATIEENAQENTIESIVINGSEVVPVEKVVSFSVPTKTSEITNDSDFTTKQYVDELYEEIAMSSDVVDVVGTYADLLQYDTQHLKENDLIKVLNDETHDNEITYYRWVNSVWVYVASEGAYYTVSQIDTMLANIDTKTLNVINASDIVNNTLTQEQYNLITNGKPTLIKGTLLSVNNIILFPPSLSGTYCYGSCIYNSPYPVQVFGEFVINSTRAISFSNSKHLRLPNIEQINGKAIPDYPSTNVLPQLLAIAENGGALSWTDVYNTIFNPNETSANTEIKWSKMLTFSKSADTTFTFETPKTNCLNEYKAIITNSGASAVVLTFTNVSNILCNDDNCVVSGNTLTLPSGTTVEINCLNNNLVAINFSAN